MTTQTEQGSHHYVLTVDLPGKTAATLHGTHTPAPGQSRQDVFLAIRREIARNNPDLERGTIIFFSLEPNQL